MPVGEAPPTHEAAPSPATERARFPWPSPMPSGRDLVVAGAATAVSVLAVLQLARATWFEGAAWDLLFDRALGDPASWFEPHQGHLDLPAVLAHQVARQAVGFDFWPGHFLPRAIGYAVMVFLMWIVLRRRGADPSIGWIALGGLLFLGPAGSLGTPAAGLLVAVPTLALAAAMLAGPGPSSTGDRVVMTGLMLALVVCGPVGLAAVAALVIVALATRRPRAVMPGLLVVAAGYAGWLLWQGGWAEDVSGVSLDAVLALPQAAWDMLGGAVAGALAFPESYGPVLAVVLVVAVAVFGMRRRLGTFEYVWLACAGLYVVVVALTAPDPSAFDPLAVPHTVVLVWLLVPAVVPHVRIGGSGTARTAVVWALGGLVVVGSLGVLSATLDRVEEAAVATRRHVEAVAGLLLAGEPSVDDAGLAGEDAATGMPLDLTVARVAEMLGDGWRPRAGEAADDETVELARGVLRMAVEPGAPSETSCMPVGESLRVSAGEYPDGVALVPVDPVVVRIRVTDEFGIGTRVVDVDAPTVVRFGDGAPGEVALSPVGPVTDLRACAPVETGG